MHPSHIAFAIALVASPLALLTPAAGPATRQPLLLAADPSLTKATPDGRPLEDAPLSNLGPQNLPAVDRAALPGTHSADAGPINGTPFSDTPSGTLSEGGSQADQHDRSFAPANDSGVVPNLGR